jgi:hypothetical protein
MLNSFIFPCGLSLEAKLACDATPGRGMYWRTRDCLPLSNFTAFGMFFDDARFFLA